MNFFRRFLRIRKRQDIRDGRIWEITQMRGWVVRRIEIKPAEPPPLVRPEGGKVDAMRVHIIGVVDNKTNITKDPDFL